MGTHGSQGCKFTPVKLLLVGCFMKVEVASKHFIGPLTREDHLYAIALDLSAHEEHWGRGADRGDVKCLNVINDVALITTREGGGSTEGHEGYGLWAVT